MQIFISWSGNQSCAIAQALSEWIPNVLQAAQPWISTEHLGKGTRWAEDLFRVLDDSRVGVFCITPSNVESPWIAFEAAACSTKVGGKVFTFLHGLRSTDIAGPLAIFNHTVAEKDDTLRLLTALNKELDTPLKEDQMKKAFERWWPDFEKELRGVPQEEQEADRAVLRSSEDMARETLELTRGLVTQIDTLQSMSKIGGQPSDSPLRRQTRDLEIRIQGNTERTRAIRYPPAAHEVGLQVVDTLRHMYEGWWLNSEHNECPEREGKAEAIVGQVIYRFAYWHNEDPQSSTVQRFFAHFEDNPGVVWQASTNIAARG